MSQYHIILNHSALRSTEEKEKKGGKCDLHIVETKRVAAIYKMRPQQFDIIA